jgi:hypothetical protein
MVDNLALCLAGCEIICSLATIGYALCLALCVGGCFLIQPDEP